MDLTGQFLIAAPSMQDPRFQETLIYIIEHGDDGATGIVVNRSIGMTLQSLFKEYSFPKLVGEKSVFWGGPVAPNQGIFLHPKGKIWTRSMWSGPGIYTTVSVDIIDDIVKGNGPSDFLFAVGYAGWSLGQLEDEIGREDWLIAPSSQEILFEMPYQMKYDAALAELGLDVNQFKTMEGMVGHA